MAETNFSLSSFNVKSFVSVTPDHTNYLMWQPQIANFFIFNGLSGYVDGTIPKPIQNAAPVSCSSVSSSSNVANSDQSSMSASKPTDTSTSSVSFETWTKYNSYVMSCITVTLSESLLHQSPCFDTVRALWESLR